MIVFVPSYFSFIISGSTKNMSLYFSINLLLFVCPENCVYVIAYCVEAFFEWTGKDKKFKSIKKAVIH